MCPRCQLAVPSDAPAGLCPRCLLNAGLEPELPRSFGRYELLKRLGEGGMGVVFEARERNPNRLVALKMIRTGELASPEERQRFRLEAEAASCLDHPNIVTIYAVSDAEQREHFTMQLIGGGTLEHHRERFQRDSRAAAQLVATVARAVHHGHERGILHRDLKPANILLDEQGQPHVADFGIAKRLGEQDETRTLGLQGTPHYMSPEQAGVGSGQVTTRSDVFSLGAILFDLLTGRPPHDGATAAEVLEKLRTAEPPRPRKLAPAVDRDLETICLKCLERNAEHRYSADQLADDLERYLRGEPIAARPPGPAERAWRWARRRPAAAGLASTVALLLLTLSVAAIFVPRALEVQLRRDANKANEAAARSVARLALLELGGYRDLVGRLAADPRIVARIDGPRCGPFGAELEEIGPRESLASMGLWDTRGLRIARWPMPAEPLACDREYDWCDYFKGSARLARLDRRSGYIARVSRSEVTGNDKFTISAPVFGADGAWRGVFYVSFGMKPVLGQWQPDPGTDPLRTVALIARRDVTRQTKDQPLPKDFFVLVHHGLEQGKAWPVASAATDRLPIANPDADQTAPSQVVVIDEHYHDPVPGFGGRWLAAFAPVGNTDYAVVVQTKYSAVSDQIDDLAKMLLFWAGLPFLVSALAVNLALFFARRKNP